MISISLIFFIFFYIIFFIFLSILQTYTKRHLIVLITVLWSSFHTPYIMGYIRYVIRCWLNCLANRYQIRFWTTKIKLFYLIHFIQCPLKVVMKENFRSLLSIFLNNPCLQTISNVQLYRKVTGKIGTLTYSFLSIWYLLILNQVTYTDNIILDKTLFVIKRLRSGSI